MAKPEKYLVEFFAKWIRDDDLRQKVLFREIEKLADLRYSAGQSAALRSLDQKRIAKLLVKELTDKNNGLGIDLQAILDAWVRYPSRRGYGGNAGFAYDEGSTHVRGAKPLKFKAGTFQNVTILGHGWDDSLKVWFENPPNSKSATFEDGVVGPVSSDIDVWQRAVVKVKLPTKGKWRVVASVKKNPQADSTENVLITAT
jgi:hypothetical protein